MAKKAKKAARKRVKKAVRKTARKRAIKKTPRKAAKKKAVRKAVAKKARAIGGGVRLRARAGAARKLASAFEIEARPLAGLRQGFRASRPAAPRRPTPAKRAKSAGAGQAASESLPHSMPMASPSIAFAGGIERFVGESPDLQARVQSLEENVNLTVALPTMDGEPIQDHKEPLHRGTFEKFRPRPDEKQLAIETLTALGFEIIRQGRFGVTVRGPARLVADVCRTNLVVQARSHRVGVRASQDFAGDFSPPRAADLFVTPTESLSVRSSIGHVDHFVFTPPPIYFQAPNPPAYTYHGVDEADIHRILNAPANLTGIGVRVALVDTGFYPHHYYSTRGLNYSSAPTTGAPSPHIDDVGHGTAIAMNVFAVAPGAQVIGYQQTDPPQDALESAADSGADIISCSWGYDNEQVFNVLQATLLSIIEEGKIVLFAAGNGHMAWPGSQPEVLSIGGVYSNAAGALEASDYASGFSSTRFPGRRTPDFCGLCGMRPKGIYIMMPTQPGSNMDQGFAGPTFPYQDQTGPNDGWVGASGTSSATPQIAGVVALMVQRARAKGVSLDANRARQILEQSARAITAGTNAMRHPASGQPNLATGWGLVDASAAVALV